MEIKKSAIRFTYFFKLYQHFISNKLAASYYYIYSLVGVPEVDVPRGRKRRDSTAYVPPRRYDFVASTARYLPSFLVSFQAISPASYASQFHPRNHTHRPPSPGNISPHALAHTVMYTRGASRAFDARTPIEAPNAEIIPWPPRPNKPRDGDPFFSKLLRV